jgi:hypothetical protein
MHVGVAVATAFLLALILGAGGRAPARANGPHAAGCGATQVCPMDGRSMRYVVSFRLEPPRP